MFRLMLLDDEEIVIKGIQKVYDLPSYGFEVVGAFSNPVKALEQFDTLQPDLIITDVKMPGMDGLEFSGLIKKRSPETELVILSGYDDFSYAQAAVKLGVSDYLLKPLKKDDFITMLRQMHEKIEKKQNREHTFRALKRFMESNVMELKNRYYLALAETGSLDEELYVLLREQGLTDFSEDSFVMIRMDTGHISTDDDYMSAIGKLTQDMELLLFDFGKVLPFWSDESLYFVLYRFESAQYEDVCDMVQSLTETRRAAGMELMTTCSDIHQGQEALFDAYNDCLRRLFLQKANIDEASEANPVKKPEINITMPYQEIEHMFQAVLVGDQIGVEASLEQIYKQPKEQIPMLFQDYCTSVSFLILLRVYQMQAKYEIAIEPVKEKLLDWKYLRQEYKSAKEQKTLVADIINGLQQRLEGQREAVPSKLVQTALEYINRHFNENISLQEVAESINISKNYLCDVFKKEIGVTFINYVTNLRIEKAKEYLRDSDMKMYEVSAAVGYNDYAYFSQIFKRNTGITLSAYRKNV